MLKHPYQVCENCQKVAGTVSTYFCEDFIITDLCLSYMDFIIPSNNDKTVWTYWFPPDPDGVEMAFKYSILDPEADLVEEYWKLYEVGELDFKVHLLICN